MLIRFALHVLRIDAGVTEPLFSHSLNMGFDVVLAKVTAEIFGGSASSSAASASSAPSLPAGGRPDPCLPTGCVREREG